MTKQDWLDAYECVKVSEDFVADAILLSRYKGMVLKCEL